MCLMDQAECHVSKFSLRTTQSYGVIGFLGQWSVYTLYMYETILLGACMI